MSANNKILSRKNKFLHDLNYGIGGIRGIFGKKPINNLSFFYLGQALGLLAKNKYRGQKVLLLQDTRESCAELLQSFAEGLAAQKITPVNCGVLPTAAATVLLEHFELADFVAVISASHNSPEFNGLKIYSKFGALTLEQIDLLNEYFAKVYSNFPVAALPAEINILDVAAIAENLYINSVVGRFLPADFAGFKKIMLDCANGAASAVAPKIFDRLGITVNLLHCTPDGKNINLQCGSTYPKVLSREVVKNLADVGFCFDGDADRVMACDAFGQIKDGDDLLAVFAMAPEFEKTAEVVGTVMSNSALEAFLAMHGKKLLRSDVGEVNVARLLAEKNLNLGGEPSGHILLGVNSHISDGIVVALSILKALAKVQNFNFKTFEKYSSILTAIKTQEYFDLESPAVQKAVDCAKSKLKDGRIFLRYSQTEPLLRILVESCDEKLSALVSAELTKILEELICSS